MTAPPLISKCSALWNSEKGTHGRLQSCLQEGGTERSLCPGAPQRPVQRHHVEKRQGRDADHRAPRSGIPWALLLPDVSGASSALPYIPQADRFLFICGGLGYLQAEHHGSVCFCPWLTLDSLSGSQGSGKKACTCGMC